MKITFPRPRTASAWIGLAILAVIVLFAWRSFSETDSDAPTFPHSTMVIQRADGKKFPFDIEVATTQPQQEYGLMFRHSMPQDAGMLFVWPVDQMVMMWMKNTYIPLDMLYVRHDGSIAKIISNAQPMDLTPLSSDENVRGVIEINAGEAARRELKPGDKVISSDLGSK